jgi:hypothetical protein
MNKDNKNNKSKKSDKKLHISDVRKSVYCDCKPYGRFNSVGVCVMCKREYHP